MFNRVLVGVDGRSGGRDAVALARKLTAPAGKVMLAHVYRDHGNPRVHGSDEDEVAQITRAHYLLAAASHHERLDAQLRWHGATSVGRGLHEIAEAIGADLLVVGSSRRGLLGRIRLADDTRAALNGAPCAIAVAPAGYSAEPPAVMREIGVGYDGSPESKQALAIARNFANQTGAKLSAFTAVAVPSYLFHGRTAVDGDVIKEVVDAARGQIAGFDGIEAHSTYGDPGEELTLYSASLDLLILGSRSYGPLGRLVHGSTSQQLARTARCPLLVLTRAAREASESAGSQKRPEIASSVA
jgi:nucleotide-binding universal stress UspA family protein